MNKRQQKKQLRRRIRLHVRPHLRGGRRWAHLHAYHLKQTLIAYAGQFKANKQKDQILQSDADLWSRIQLERTTHLHTTTKEKEPTQ